MSFEKDSHIHTLKCIQVIPLDIIISHHMENPLKKGHLGIIAQFQCHSRVGYHTL